MASVAEELNFKFSLAQVQVAARGEWVHTGQDGLHRGFRLLLNS